MGKYIEGRKSLEVSETLSYFPVTISRIEVGVLKTLQFFLEKIDLDNTSKISKECEYT